MAAIALITYNVAETAATKTKAAFEAKGHTVTLVVEGDIGTHDFSGYDCAAAVQCTPSPAVANALRALVDGGLPMFVGSVPYGAGFIPELMNLTGAMSADFQYGFGTWTINITNGLHDITSPFGTVELNISDNTQYWVCVASGEPYAGTVLAVGTDRGGGTTDLTGLVDTLAISQGTMDLAGIPVAIGAKVVVSGALFGGTSVAWNYVSTALDFFDSVIAWLTAAAPIPGTGEALKSRLSLALGLGL